MSETTLASAPTATTTTRRTDIDGLRAVAVGAVLLCHTGLGLFSGGWIGVDVFFVISGFLITGIITRELSQDRFTFRRFYLRRVRRILPAATATVLLCFPFAWWLMLPDFLQNFGQSAVATMLSANNFLLAVTSGYWALESAFKPLLHTWSLGVEEQFYVVFPLIFVGIMRFFRQQRTRVIAALAVLAAGSLVWAQVAIATNPDVAFYLPQYRAWELLIGAMASFAVVSGRRWEQFLPSVGLIAVVVSAIAFSPTITPAPGAWMLVPVLGTAAVLVYGPSDPWAQRLLNLRPMVFIGLISYSAYLVHQPIFAFIRVASLSEPSPWLFVAVLPVVVVVAWLSWRFIEEPFRDQRRVSTRAVFASLIPPFAVILALGLVLHFSQGFPQRVFPLLTSKADVYVSYNERVRAFTIGQPQAPTDPDIVVVGDSFGRDTVNALLEADPALTGRVGYAEPANIRAAFDQSLLAQLRPVVTPKTLVVLAMHDQSVEVGLAQIAQLNALHPRAIEAFGTKSFGWNLNPYGRVPLAERPASRVEVLPAVEATNDAFAASVPHYIDVIRLLGRDGHSVPVFDGAGNLLSPDRNHLTRYGAVLLGDRLRTAAPQLFTR